MQFALLLVVYIPLTSVFLESFRTDTPTCGEQHTCLPEGAGSQTLVVRLTGHVRERVYRVDDPASVAILVTGGDCSV